ncbi:ABC-type nitrate/sulfonate/bicarbonate transport system substrate-binding protein [Promicromonospora sp. AC04]|uniref:ABC transporter substrate-binding protein n=1 Tax=Promicromonospora sp. AC04 TaxID=2135723 RepID=UPI000D4E6B95|nr:ABC transporter substrate-binding protein [Promicromonospora sp. AC04]PUB26962.1 ABC-type nitrate/sulfonate/bicarbonate transport system substrate-binding protein [Promicromonospora sp. AC04]
MNPTRVRLTRPLPTRSLPTRTARLAALLAIGLVAAAGCANRGATEPATGADAMTLDVGQISDSVAFFPIFVAEDQGFFEDEGLTLAERPRLGTGAKLAAALESDSIDIAGGVMTDAYNLYQINDGARVIGSLVNEYYVDIIAGEGIPESLDDAPLDEKVGALEGKAIGITGPGSGTEALVSYLLAQQDLDTATDVTLVNLGADPSAAVGALKAGRVDALSFFQPVGEQAEATGVGRIFISPARGDVPELADAVHGALFTTQEVMDHKPDATAAFVRGIARAEELISTDDAAAAELLQKYQSTMNPDTVALLAPVLQEEIPESPVPTESGYETSAAFHQESGLIPEPPSYADLVPSAWIESALQEK